MQRRLEREVQREVEEEEQQQEEEEEMQRDDVVDRNEEDAKQPAAVARKAAMVQPRASFGDHVRVRVGRQELPVGGYRDGPVVKEEASSPPVQQDTDTDRTCTRDCLHFITTKIPHHTTPTKTPPRTHGEPSLPPPVKDNPPVPVEVRVHTPLRVPLPAAVTGRNNGLASEEQALVVVENDDAPATSAKTSQPTTRCSGGPEEQMPVHNLAAQVKKLEERLQRLGDNNDVGEQDDDDECFRSASDGASDEGTEADCREDASSGQEGGLLDDVSACTAIMSTTSSTNIPRPPLFLIGEPTGLPRHPYRPVAVLDQQREDAEEDPSIFEDIIVGRFLEGLEDSEND